MTPSNPKRRPGNLRARRGAMLVLVAITLVILLIAAALSVDVAYMHMVRAELRTATDAAARAGAETLSRTQDEQEAIDAAIRIAEANSVAGNTLTLRREDVVIGGIQENANGSFAFVPGLNPSTSVRVTGARLGDSPDGPVALFFGRVFGAADFSPQITASATASVRDIALVLDRSGSMAASAGGLTRLAALQLAVNAFAAEIEASSPNAQMSLTTYATNATRDIALTDDFGRIRNQVGQLQAQGFTNIFQALRFGSDSLEQDPNRRQFAERTIVLMTDGNFNVGGTPIPSANVARSRNHVIHTITFGGGANQAIMRDVAAIGEGIHLHADDAGDLTAAFREIARTISVLLIE